ncbi:MAG: D-Ala-D-Ala carboxypeptidase family metallohydrolase [Akkermansiaceae bacterium]|jgi:hypothetical protein|nr:D-Ala-D-Ala carboxypeptidase family metallohydrolase [Akkermansiaceae bacterium]
MISSDSEQTPESAIDSLIDRRSAMGTLGLAGMGMLLSTDFSLAAPSKAAPKVTVPTSSRPAVQPVQRPAMAFAPVNEIPDEWRTLHGRAAAEYLRYLQGLNLRRVSPHQVIATHAKKKGDVWNSIPPKAWWNRMGYVLRVVERVAMEMNVNQVEVVSAYRSPAYNARCAGARTGSWHQANVAADVKFPVRASQVTATARQLRDLGLFKGGVGGYWNFTHIDARGQNINW